MNRSHLSPPSSRAVEHAALHACSANARNKVFQTWAMALRAAAPLLATPCNAVAQASAYVQNNIISDGAVPAQQTDSTLIDPWGISIGPQFWIDAPGSGFSLVEKRERHEGLRGQRSPGKDNVGSRNSLRHGLQRELKSVSDGWRIRAVSLRHARWNHCRMEHQYAGGRDPRQQFFEGRILHGYRHRQNGLRVVPAGCKFRPWHSGCF